MYRESAHRAVSKGGDLVATLFISIEEARELLGAPRRRNTFLFESGLDSATLRLKAVGANKTEVYFVESEDSDFVDIKLVFVNSYGKEMTPVIDQALVARLDKLLALNPRSKFLKSLRDEALVGEDIHPNAMEVVEEIEDKIANPDTALIARLDAILAKLGNDTFINSLKSQVLAGRELSSAQYAALTKIEMRLSGVDSNSKRVNDLLAVNPTNRFLISLKNALDSGRPLTTKQIAVLDKIEATTPPPAPAPVKIDRRTKKGKRLLFLKDMLHANLPAKEDSFLSSMYTKIVKDTIPTENEFKQIRHIAYRFERKLSRSYGRDYKAHVRAIFNG